MFSTTHADKLTSIFAIIGSKTDVFNEPHQQRNKQSVIIGGKTDANKLTSIFAIIGSKTDSFNESRQQTNKHICNHEK